MLDSLTSTELAEWTEIYRWESEGCPTEEKVSHQTVDEQVAFWKFYAPLHNARVEAVNGRK